MPAVAIGAVGLGLSAASTISQMDAQKREKDRQNALIDANLLELEDRLTLAKMHTQATKEGAAILRDREQQIINAQRVQSRLQIQEQGLQNQLAQMQAGLQAKGIEEGAKQFAASTIAQAQDEAAQVMFGASGELEQAKQIQVSSSATNGSSTAVANESRAADKVATLQSRLGENADYAKALANLNYEQAQRIGNNQIGLAGIESGYIRDTAALQAEADKLFTPYANRQVGLTSRRNQLASRGAQQTREASADMNLLTQQMQTMYQSNSLNAQRPTGGGGALEGVLNIASQGVGMASQLGLFGGGGSSSARQTSMPTQSWGFGSQRLGVYSGTPQTVDNPVGVFGTSKSNLGLK